MVKYFHLSIFLLGITFNLMAGEFVSINTPGKNMKSNFPKGSLAAKLCKNGISFRWQAALKMENPTHPADLLDGAISPDETIMVLGERLIGNNESNSSRLIFMELGNGEIVNGLELKNRLLTKFQFLPDNSGKILALQEPQPQINSERKIVGIDLVKGKVWGQSVPLSSPLSSMASCGERVWYTLATDNYLHELSLPSFKKSNKTRVLKSNNSSLALGGSGKVLAVIGKKEIEWYELNESGELVLLDNFSTTELDEIEWAEITSEANKELIFTTKTGKCYWLSGGNIVTISTGGTGRGVFHSSTQSVLIEMIYKNLLVPISLPSGEKGRGVNPGSLRPTNKNDSFKIFSRSGLPWEVVLIDCKGNIYKITILGRRWQKSLLKGQR